MGSDRNGQLNDAPLRRLAFVAGALGLWLGSLALPIKLCLVALVFHVPCPGCGMTRAAFAMLRGDFTAAYAFHPLSLVLVPALGAFLGGQLVRYVQTGRAWGNEALHPITTSLAAIFTVLLIGIWMARMLGFLGGPVSI